MENNIQEQLVHQQEMLRDLQSRLAQSTDEEEKKSLQLKMNVVDAKIKELQAKQSSAPVNEGTPEELEIETPEEQLDEAYSHKEEIKKLSDHIKTLKGSVDKIEQACKKENWFDIIDKIEDTESLVNMLKFHYNNVYNASKNKTLTESVESKKDFLKHLDDYEKDVKKAIDSIRKNIKDSKKTSGMDGDYLVSMSSAISNALTRYNHSVDTKTLTESLPSNYSKSKYLKEVQDATKAIRSVCERIDKLAKKGDEWSMYSLPSDFKSIANFAGRCAEDSADIYGYMKKGTLTEAVSKNQLQTGSILYFPELKTYWMVGGTVFNNQLKLYKCDKNGKLPKLLGEREIMAVTNNDLQKAQLVKTLSRDEIKQVNLTEAVLPQDKAQWEDAVKFGKSHGHPAPKLKLGQKTSKGEVVALWYGRLSAAPMYSVSKDGGKTVKEYYEEELMEGCMTKKFENMTNREIASYIFSHPHTKFASKMKECDDKEIMKAIRAMKKTEEEAPVTNTSAVATAEAPSMFMKKKLNESVTSDITEILDDVEDAYGMKARKILNDAIYHNKWGMQPDYFLRCANKLTDKGYFGDFILSIIEDDEREYRNLIKKC